MVSRTFPFTAWILGATVVTGLAHGQAAIPFENNGLHYRALTRGGMTIMIAKLDTRVRDWEVFQIAITNGSPVAWEVKAEDFSFQRETGAPIPALSSHEVVETMLKKASRNDTTRLVVAYEAALFGNIQLHTTNGYENRRQDAMAFGSTRLSAAGAASAIVLAPSKLAAGQSTDGAIFYPDGGKPLGAGKLIANIAGEEFVFPVEVETPSHR
ncbi:MAG TPA: hypothetical protein VGG72_04480 [Bryobacteraceae bacterium]|jgi:hypothetical protein